MNFAAVRANISPLPPTRWPRPMAASPPIRIWRAARHPCCKVDIMD